MNRLPRWLSRYLSRRGAPRLIFRRRAAHHQSGEALHQNSQERLASLLLAVECLHRREISGAIAESGVWAGGRMMAVTLMLLDLGTPIACSGSTTLSRGWRRQRPPIEV